MSASRGLLLATAMLLGSILAGCQTETVSPSAQARARSKVSDTQAPLTDQCGSNMHDLAGYLLQYYALNRDLPPTLEDLRPLVDPGKELPLSCPVSGKPYRYAPGGLVAANEPRTLIVVDPEPVHNGGRWAIVSIPPEGRTPLGLWAVRLNEAAAQQFHTP